MAVTGMAWAQGPAPQPLPSPSAAPAPAGWTFSFAWSPEYCKRNLGSKELQCLQEHYFELSGLAPRFDGPGPECQRDPLPRELLPRALEALPNEALLKKAWRNGGACSGLPASEYILQLERAGRRISMPERFRSTGREARAVSKHELEEAFRQDNPGLSEAALVRHCQRGWLEGISFCVDGGFGFQDCPLSLVDSCPERLQLRPLRPALRSRGAAD